MLSIPLFEQCCRINPAYLAGTKKFTAPEVSEAPLIVFINSRSGGHAGPKLTEVLYQSLGHAQVQACQAQMKQRFVRLDWEYRGPYKRDYRSVKELQAE